MNNQTQCRTFVQTILLSPLACCFSTVYPCGILEILWSSHLAMRIWPSSKSFLPLTAAFNRNIWHTSGKLIFSYSFGSNLSTCYKMVVSFLPLVTDHVRISYIYIYIYIYIWMHGCICAYICIYVLVHTYGHLYINKYVYIYFYTFYIFIGFFCTPQLKAFTVLPLTTPSLMPLTTLYFWLNKSRYFPLHLFHTSFSYTSGSEYLHIYSIVDLVTEIILLWSDNCGIFHHKEFLKEVIRKQVIIFLVFYCSACKHASTLNLFPIFAFCIASYF